MKQIDLYCDESRQDLLVNKDAITPQNRYVCIGGLLVPREKRSILKNRINNLKRTYGIEKEFKWGNVSGNKSDFYKKLVELLFDEEFSDVCFRCVVIDACAIDNKKYNSDDHELGYYKFYYQLIHNWLSTDSEYYIYTDYKTNKDRDRLSELKRILNKGNKLRNSEVKIVQAIDSSESAILQLQNIIMGTVAYRFNYGDKGLSVAKNELVKCVEKNLGHRISATYSSAVKFNVFVIKLSGGIS